MVEDQIAETHKKAANELKSQLDVQNVEIQAKKEKEYADLEKAEPTCRTSKQSVSNIKKRTCDLMCCIPKKKVKCQKNPKTEEVLTFPRSKLLSTK